MKWLSRSLFRKLLISYLIPILLGFVVMGALLSFSIRNHVIKNTEQELLRQGKSINQAIQQTPLSELSLKTALIFFEQTFGKKIVVFDTTGKIIAASYSDEVFQNRKYDDPKLLESMISGNIVKAGLGMDLTERPVYSVIVPWGSEDTIFGGIEISTPAEGIDIAFRNVREIVVWSILFGIILSTALVSILFWSISRPLKRIEHAAMEIAIGQYDKRVPCDTNDEIGELAMAFNRMAGKLDEIERERSTLEQTRDEYIANISHELRTPLTAIQGFLEAMQDGLVRDEESKTRYYKVMYDETIYMKRLVDDLMDLIKLKNGKVTLTKYYVNIGEIVQKLRLTIQPHLDKKNNRLEISCPSDIPPILADADRLEQILSNLVHNANKFTKDGIIKVEVLSTEEKMMIKITDTGIGIPSHDIGRIWERFYKAHRSRNDKDSGSGLGLAIVKELVELHGGTIDVNSEIGKGTSFVISLQNVHPF